MVNSKQKGARAERNLSKVLNSYGYDTHRTAQYSGKNGGDADLIGMPGIHVECKHAEQMRLYDWIAQAKRDASAKPGYELPCVFHRKNNAEWLVSMRLDDWQVMYDKYYEHVTGEKGVSR